MYNKGVNCCVTIDVMTLANILEPPQMWGMASKLKKRLRALRLPEELDQVAVRATQVTGCTVTELLIRCAYRSLGDVVSEIIAERAAAKASLREAIDGMHADIHGSQSSELKVVIQPKPTKTRPKH